MTQFAMEDIAHIGLLKMDFLGLANLTILGKAGEIIKQRPRPGHRPAPPAPGRHQDLRAALGGGDRRGLPAGRRRHAPLHQGPQADHLQRYRRHGGPLPPRPHGAHPHLHQGQARQEPIRYPHPALEDILKETYGVIVYQEQVLFIVRAFAGYSLGQADIFRKAMGKKIAEVMQKEKRNFISGRQEAGLFHRDRQRRSSPSSSRSPATPSTRRTASATP